MAKVAPANAAILPGCLLPYRGLYQQLAGTLPAGAILVVLPAGETRGRSALELLALQLRSSGHQVITMVDEARRHQIGIQAQLPLGV
jgi:hypothetical protein